MIYGDPTIFALESGITKAYERLGFLALGYFVIHIGGRCYGVCESNATMLACSFDGVERRIAQRGTHTAPFAAESDAGQIADAYRYAIYAPDEDCERFFANSTIELNETISRSDRFVWAPDGDEAFDDWSHVLQFDVGGRVRVIGFKSSEVGYAHAQETLTDVWLESDDFYAVLKQWRDAFVAEWKAAPKIAESEDGAELSRPP